MALGSYWCCCCHYCYRHRALRRTVGINVSFIIQLKPPLDCSIIVFASLPLLELFSLPSFSIPIHPYPSRASYAAFFALLGRDSSPISVFCSLRFPLCKRFSTPLLAHALPTIATRRLLPHRCQRWRTTNATSTATACLLRRRLSPIALTAAQTAPVFAASLLLVVSDTLFARIAVSCVFEGWHGTGAVCWAAAVDADDTATGALPADGPHRRHCSSKIDKRDGTGSNEGHRPFSKPSELVVWLEAARRDPLMKEG